MLKQTFERFGRVLERLPCRLKQMERGLGLLEWRWGGTSKGLGWSVESFGGRARWSDSLQPAIGVSRLAMPANLTLV